MDAPSKAVAFIEREDYLALGGLALPLPWAEVYGGVGL